MVTIISVSVLMIVLFVWCCGATATYYKTKSVAKGEKNIEYMNLAILLAAAFVLRVIAAVSYKGHDSDMGCFTAWANMVYEGGIGAFYKSESFHDYPPGYMYVLYVIGMIRHLFSIDSSGQISILLTKMPAILCDLLTGVLVYRVAAKKYKGTGALMFAGMYLLNPAIFMNSAIWGQVDAVFTLFVALVCYFVSEEKLPLAYFSLAIGILIKPQTMIFTPVLIYGIIDQVFLHNFSLKRMGKELALGLLAIGMMALLAMPFGLSDVIAQYTQTVTSYPYASVNAYNLWTLLGLNWGSQDTVRLGLSCARWGTVFIVLFVAASAWFNFKSKKTQGKYYFLGAFIIISMFILSVRMHERYMFPAIVLLLLAYIEKPKKQLFGLYTSFSVFHFINTAHVLFIRGGQNFDNWETAAIVISFLGMCAYVFLVMTATSLYTKEENILPARQPKNAKNSRTAAKNKKTFSVRPTMAVGRMEKKDWIYVSVITVIYAVIAFYNLGDMEAPQSGYAINAMGEEFVIDLGEVTHITGINCYNGYQNNPKFTLEVADDSGVWVPAYDSENPFDVGKVFHWNRQSVDLYARYLHFVNTSGACQLMELALTGEDGALLVPSNVEAVAALFDEQELYPERTTNMNSTYFDEIYHARTAYEMIHGMYCYENTHPPLGKIIIAIGIRIFGMCPFGWRFMGTLFGVLMIPAIYVFAKCFFRERWISVVTTLLFTFDFMHFAQTRIATIDVFITFFVILMYYFMYQYTQMSFYDTKLTRTWIPLAFSGLFMGIGCATKWTGVYAGIGLAIIFFATMFRRYREYAHAIKNPRASSNGIAHEKIVKSFFPNMWKTYAFCLVVFVAVPCLIYLLSYIPFSDGSDRGLFARMMHNITVMYDYHSNLVAEHDFASPWYQWPVMHRPVWYYSGYVSETVREGISAFGNPLVWWAGIPAFAYMLWRMIKDKDNQAAFLNVSYLAQYVPWFFVSRLTYIYHYFPSVPFITFMVAGSIYYLGKDKQGKEKPRCRALAYGYVAAAILLFMLFYPVLAGRGVTLDFVDTWLRWFDSWVLTSS